MAIRPPVIQPEEVIIHGDFGQFLGVARCEACQARSLKCALQESDEGCMACAGAGRDCVFVRTVTVTGPKSMFSWGSLTAAEQGSVRLNANLAVTGAGAGAKPESITIAPAPGLHARPLYTPEPSSARLSTGELPSPALRRFDELPSRPDARPAYAPSAPSERTARVGPTAAGGPLRRERSVSSSERSRRNGLDPARRDTLGDEHLPSIVDQEQRAQLDQKNAQIVQWLQQDPVMLEDGDMLMPGAETPGDVPSPIRPLSSRKSFGNGLGMEDGKRADSPPAIVHLQPHERDAGSSSPTSAFALIDAHPWVEPMRFPSMPGTISQPATSNAAMVRFGQCADAVETASRAASHGESAGLIGADEMDLLSKHPGVMARLALGPPSMAPPLDFSPPASAPPMNRTLRPKPPAELQPFDLSPTLDRSKTTPITASGSPGLDSPRRTSTNRPASYTSRWATVNPPPKAVKTRTRSVGHRLSRTATELSDDMDDANSMGEGWLVGDLSAEFLEPTYESFAQRIRDREPRIEDFLSERLTKEQLHRYKNLIDLKTEHAAKHAGQCSNGAFCIDSPQFRTAQGLAAQGLAAQGLAAQKDEPSKEEDGAETGYAVEPALFPPGVPLPPVKRLPAEFECPFCFTVRTFQKPSDWSKHIQEDVAPFICTFPHCPEPKSFKRKADWVRHENERHRQLEWWQCNKEGCLHICYRRDNFVQHLVREHKMAEPKPKTSSGTGGAATRGPERVTSSKHSAEEQVIKMVDACRRETTKNPAEEPCRFCGNRCNSFKKLTVHLARHMETISLPILDLVVRFDASSAVGSEVPLPPSQAVATPTTAPLPPRVDSPINVIVPAQRRPSSLEAREPPVLPSPHPHPPPESPAAPKPLLSISTAPAGYLIAPLQPPPPPPQTVATWPTVTDKPASARPEKTYRCEVPGCTHDRSFASQNDLNRHMKGVHGIYQGGSDPRFFRCQGQDCSKEGKIWPRLDNFRGHIARMHPDEDVEELIKRSGFTTADGIPPGEQEMKMEPDKEREREKEKEGETKPDPDKMEVDERP